MATKRPTPTDHKDPEPRFTDVAGHELLTPPAKVKGSDQARLLHRLRLLGVLPDDDTDTVEVSVIDVDLEALADFIDYVGETFAVDPDTFDEFTMGAGGMDRALHLTIAYAGEVGKGVS